MINLSDKTIHNILLSCFMLFVLILFCLALAASVCVAKGQETPEVGYYFWYSAANVTWNNHPSDPSLFQKTLMELEVKSFQFCGDEETCKLELAPVAVLPDGKWWYGTFYGTDGPLHILGGCIANKSGECFNSWEDDTWIVVYYKTGRNALIPFAVR